MGLLLEKRCLVVMIGKDAFLRTRLPTLFKKTELLGDITQSRDDFLITIVKGEDGIRNARVATKVQYEFLGAPQVVARDSGVEMMDGLELQTAVEEVQPSGAINIHGGPEHFLGK